MIDCLSCCDVILKFVKLRHFFLPHPETHQKAHLLSFKALAVYILFFLCLEFSFSYLSKTHSEVLGISASLNQQELIALTNAQRARKGLVSLTEDSRLNQAASEKAKNMFQENYWAHYSPSGRDPWGFILRAGYKFTYAGENLARNFYTSPEVVNAWMESPTHRDNLLNPKYLNIGMAVAEGTINGQSTILVVQEFGTPFEAIAQVSPAPTSLATLLTEPQNSGPVAGIAQARNTIVASEQLISGDKIDPYLTMKYVGLGFLFGLFILILLDLYILRRRAVTRLTSRHLPHLGLISVSAAALVNMNIGKITEVASSIVLPGVR